MDNPVLKPDLLSDLAGASAPSGLPTASGVAFHSGRVRPGDAFFALPGAAGHGMSHAAQALERGAAYIVSDQPHPRGLTVPRPTEALLALGRYARSRLRGPVVAVSGSAGKTTTKNLAAAGLDAYSSEGNLNTPLALACILIRAWLADPSRALVLELGIDHPGEMDRLVDLVTPTHGLLTTIGESHLDRLGSLEGVAREKARLLERSPIRIASVDAARQLPRPPAGLIRYGLAGDAEVSGRLTERPGGQLLEALGVSLELPHAGTAMAENALAALTLAWLLGRDPAAAARRIAGARLEPGRLERKELAGRLVIDDSYNSNPASARRALEVLARSRPPRCALLGDMLELGDRSESLHRELGAATRGLDLVVAVGPQARFIAAENPAALHAQGIAEAIELLDRLPPGGSVLVKGSRGMRLERLVNALAEGAAAP